MAAFPIDNKNLLEDAFEDDVFQGFYWAPEHRAATRTRHLIGSVKTENYDALVSATWRYCGHSVEIRVVGTRPAEDIQDVRSEVYAHYERIFKGWECEDNEGLHVVTKRNSLDESLQIFFYLK